MPDGKKNLRYFREVCAGLPVLVWLLAPSEVNACNLDLRATVGLYDDVYGRIADTENGLSLFVRDQRNHMRPGHTSAKDNRGANRVHWSTLIVSNTLAEDIFIKWGDLNRV